MEAPVLAAIIALGGAALAALVNAFLVESYRRFREGSAVAAGLAGELSSYAPAYPLLRNTLVQIIKVVDDGNLDRLFLRKFERPKDRVFEKAIDKLGLLPVELIADIVFVYGNIDGFRIAFEVLSNEFRDMPDFEVKGRAQAALSALDNAAQRGEQLFPHLLRRANARFLRLPWPYD